MATYLIGDLHGCYDELIMLLSKVKFNPNLDVLWITGDLVFRGPHSLKVLRFLHKFKKSVKIVLGNHDLHLLSMYYFGLNKKNNNMQINQILKAPDISQLIAWLSCQPLLHIDDKKKIIMVHAGISPQWNIDIARYYAEKLTFIISNKENNFIFKKILKSKKNNNWHNNSNEFERLQFSINVFTKIRYCFFNGCLEMNYKNSPMKAPLYLKPWFNLIEPIIKKYNVIFGHWASLINYNTPNGIFCLDSGCCWGGKLTLLQWEEKKFIYQPFIKK